MKLRMFRVIEVNRDGSKEYSHWPDIEDAIELIQRFHRIDNDAALSPCYYVIAPVNMSISA